MDLDGPRRPRWPAITESELITGYSGLVATRPRRTETVSPPEPAPVDVRRRPSPLHPGDRRGPLGEAVRAALRGRDAGAPVRLVIYAPGPWAVSPWLRWLRDRGWHVHVVGRAAYAHHPDRADLPGWLVGFAVAGEPEPAWLRWLATHRTRIRTPLERAASRTAEGMAELVR